MLKLFEEMEAEVKKLEGEAAEELKKAVVALKALVIKVEADEKAKAAEIEAYIKNAMSAYHAVKAEIEALEQKCALGMVAGYEDLKQFISAIKEIVAKL
jgi:hypothetical protein